MTIGSAVKSGPSNVAPLVLRMAVRVLAARPCRWSEIGAELDHASRENVLALPVAAENAAAAWEDLDLSHKRAAIKTLMTITLHSPGQGARRPFDSGTVGVDCRHPVAD